MATTALDALRTLQRELGERQADVVPAGWRTAEQWATEAGMSRKHVEDLLRAGVQAGRVEKHVYRLLIGSGLRGVNHYRMV
jgi:predicted transcriptional regulator